MKVVSKATLAVATFAAILSFQNCSQSGGNSAVTKSMAGVDTDGDGEPDVDDAGRPLISGSWKQGCVTLDGFGTRATATFTETSYVISRTLYMTSGCTGLAASGRLEGTYVVGDLLEAPAGAYKLDLVIVKGVIKVENPLVAGELNRNAICGITDWVAGVERDVTGLTCENIPFPSGFKGFDIVSRQGSSMKMGLLSELGSDSDMTSEERRPKSFEPLPYLKQ